MGTAESNKGEPGEGEALTPRGSGETATDDFPATRARIIERIADACVRAGRVPSGVTLVAVTKTVPAYRVQEAVRAGFDVLGENRVQEAAAKIPAIGGRMAHPGRSGRVEDGAGTSGFSDRSGVRWHLIGPLQSNKARRAVELFDVVETVDSVALAARLDRLAGEVGRERLDVLLEVNVDVDPAKSGFTPAAVALDLPSILELPRLRVLGLMSVGRLVPSPEEARPTFRRLRVLSERLRSDHRALGPALSMGMTDDFEVAVEEGATIVRIGRAIFGERPSV